MILDIIDFEKRIPDFIGNIKDCWLTATVLVAISMAKDYRVLFLHNSFQYSEENDGNEISFHKVICKHMDLDFKGNYMNPIVANEDLFLHKIMGFNVSYYSLENIAKEREQYLKTLMRENVSVMWFDTFSCPWNPMYQQRHVLHCIAVIKTKGDICYVYDSLKMKHAVFSIDLDFLFDIGRYVFIYKDELQNPINNIEMAYQHYANEILRSEKLQNQILSNLKLFYMDCLKLKENIINNAELEDENTVRLMMRLFENQYERVSLQQMVYEQIACVKAEHTNVLERLKMNWKIASLSFARTCFLPVSKRETTYSALCLSVQNIVEDSALLF